MKHLLNFIVGVLTLTSTVEGLSATPISPQDAYAAATTNRAILIDVREEAELTETGIAEFAVWLPTSAIETRSIIYKEALQNWPKEQKLIFYCRSGRRSEKAADHFATQGYRTLNAGSFQAWKDAGLPIKSFTAPAYLPNLP